jgi:TatD DNase family protein
MMIYCDIHTHRAAIRPTDRVVTAVSPGQAMLERGGCYAVGVHPWFADGGGLPWLYEQARREDVVAIGETGLDKRKGPAMTVQEAVFMAHIRLAEETGRALIIHCVGAWEEIVRLRRGSAAPIRWIVHGFRGNGGLARQLLKGGFDLSFGRRFNAEAVAVAWEARRLFAETDDDGGDICLVYEGLAAAVGVSIGEIGGLILENFEEAVRRD